jgi:hypothetical protein
MWITEQKSKNVSWNVRPCFFIEIHKQDLTSHLRCCIQNFFHGVGNISIRSNRNSAMYRVLDINSLQNPHINM